MMRKTLIALLCAAMLFSIAAYAQAFDLPTFFKAYLLTATKVGDGSGLTFCAFDRNSAVMACSDGSAIYKVVDSVDDPSLDVPNIWEAFALFCSTYDYDAFLYDNGSIKWLYAVDNDAEKKIMERFPKFLPDMRYDDRTAFAEAVEADIYADVDLPTEEGIIEDMGRTDAVGVQLAEAIAKLDRFDMLRGSSLIRVEANPNYGTPESGDFIGLIYMVYDSYTTPANDYDLITGVSTTIATLVSHDCKEVCEMCVFWELPGYNLNAKYQYFIVDGSVEFGDVMVPSVMVK